MSRRGPPPIAIALLVLPALGIAGAVGYHFYVRKDEPQVETPVVDQNEQKVELEREVDRLYAEKNEIVRIDPEDPQRQGRIERLGQRIDRWEQKFEAMTKPFQDENGYLKKEYEGTFYPMRQRVSTLRFDLNRMSNF